MKERPIAKYSDLQRDLLHVTAKSPGANGEQLRRRLEDARDERVPESTLRTHLRELVEAELIDKSGPQWERSHELTDDGQQLLDDDLDWQRER